MSEDRSQDNFNRDRAELFEALGHPIRLEILQALSAKPLGFSELKREVEIESSGHLSFHLGKLKDLVKTTPEGYYKLTDDGRAALHMVQTAKVSGGVASRSWEGKATSRRQIWLAISLYAALSVFIWLDYFMRLTGHITLEGALFGTVATPLIIFIAIKVRQIKNLRFWRLAWTIFGAAVFGFIIFFIVNFILYRLLALPVWVEMDGLIRELLTMPASYVIGAYLGYWLGKRREFVPLLF